MFNIQFNHKQKGLSLLELLIASTLGMFILALILNSYLGLKRVYDTQLNLSSLQDNARLVDHQVAFSGFSQTAPRPRKISQRNRLQNLFQRFW